MVSDPGVEVVDCPVLDRLLHPDLYRTLVPWLWKCLNVYFIDEFAGKGEKNK